MEERYNWKKEIRVAFVMLLVIAVFIIGITAYAVKFLSDHPTYYKYEDDWIIGKTQEQIEERYGEVDFSFDGYDEGTDIGYHIDIYDFWGHILWDPENYSYYILMDADGKAEKVTACPTQGPDLYYAEQGNFIERIFFIFGISFYA